MGWVVGWKTWLLLNGPTVGYISATAAPQSIQSLYGLIVHHINFVYTVNRELAFRSYVNYVWLVHKCAAGP